MKSDKRIKVYNKKYKNELDQALRIVEPYLIDAFTMFYGEEYRDQIRTTIKNVGYTYFLSETFFELFERKSFGVSLKDQRVIRYYLKYLKKLKFRYDRIHDLDALEAEILETLIVKSTFDHKTLIYSNFLEFLSCDVPVYSLMIEEGEDFFYKSIFLRFL